MWNTDDLLKASMVSLIHWVNKRNAVVIWLYCGQLGLRSVPKVRIVGWDLLDWSPSCNRLDKAYGKGILVVFLHGLSILIKRLNLIHPNTLKSIGLLRSTSIIVQKDKDGQFCYCVARNFQTLLDESEIKKLENAVIQKDIDGFYCYFFARDVKGADIQKLQQALIQKDPNRCYWDEFVENVPEANIQEFQKYNEKKLKLKR